jgi:hypothetical protein
MEREPFIVDFTDPRDMAAKLTEAERILDETHQKLAEVAPLQRKAQEWQVNVDFLRAKIGSAAPQALPSSNGSASPGHGASNGVGASNGAARADVQTHVVGVVNREVRKIKASDVRDTLASEGHVFTPEQVSNALHHAANGPKLIQKIPERGMYAPLAYREVELTPPVVMGAVTNGAMIQNAEFGGTVREDVQDFGGSLPGK